KTAEEALVATSRLRSAAVKRPQCADERLKIARRLLDRKPKLLHRLYSKTRLLRDVFNLSGILRSTAGSERDRARKRAIRYSRFLSYSSHALKRLIERHGPLLKIFHPLLRSLEALGKTRSPCA